MLLSVEGGEEPLGDDRSAIDLDWSNGLAFPLSESAPVRPEWWACCRD
jgi:hypothetical protein